MGRSAVDGIELEPVVLDAATLNWLLDPADPALRAKVLVDLLDRSVDDPDVIAARKAIPSQPFVRAALEAWAGGRVHQLGPYQKYRGATWTLAHLSEMGLPAEHPVAAEGAAYLLSAAKPVQRVRGRDVAPLDGAQPVSWIHPIACLTARMVTVLSRFGLPDHAVTRGARATLHHLHRPGWGLDCGVLDRSLLPACIMTLPETLKALLTIPAAERTPNEDRMLEDGVQVLQGIGLFRYVPAQAQAFAKATRHLPLEDVRTRKTAWIAQGRLDERVEKAGWLRLSFPHGYNADLLEVLWVLALAGAQRNEAIDRGLALLLTLRTRTGRWKQTGGLNGKMWADRGQKGRDDPWITYRSLTVLKSFEMLRA
ncbi:MAG: hypothetical protein P8Y13_14200 [Deinococcales bacterium]